MSAPTPYVLTYDFTAFQEAHPSTPLPADKVEIEFNNLQTTTDDLIHNLGLIQRNDGSLQANIVGTAQLKGEVIIGLNAATDWVTSTIYTNTDTVFNNSKLYRCLVDHVSGTFATDLASSYWLLMVDFGTFFSDASTAATASAASQTASAASATAASASQTASAASQTAAAASATSASTSAASAEDWASKTSGEVAATDYSAKAYAVGGTGTETNNAKYYSEQAALLVTGDVMIMTEQGSTPTTPASGDSKLYFGADSMLRIIDDTGTVRIPIAAAGAGTAGQLPISQGAGLPAAWGAGSNSRLLSTQNAAASAALNFTLSTKKRYELVIIDLLVTSAAHPLFEITSDGGSTYKAGGSDYDWVCTESTLTSVTVTNSAADNYVKLTGGRNLTSTSTKGLNGRITIYNPAGTTRHKAIESRLSGYDTGPAKNTWSVDGTYIGATTAINGCRLILDTSTYASGTVELWEFD